MKPPRKGVSGSFNYSRSPRPVFGVSAPRSCRSGDSQLRARSRHLTHLIRDSGLERLLQRNRAAPPRPKLKFLRPEKVIVAASAKVAFVPQLGRSPDFRQCLLLTEGVVHG